MAPLCLCYGLQGVRGTRKSSTLFEAAFNWKSFHVRMLDVSKTESENGGLPN